MREGERSSYAKSYHDHANPLVQYCAKLSIRLHPAQKKIIEATSQVERSFMMGAPEVCQFNMNMMKLIKAKKCLEIGTYTGVGAIAAAVAVPDDGKVIAIDVTDTYWQKAGADAIIKEAGLADKIDFRVDPDGAAKVLDELIANGEAGTFDFAFIDADKEGYDSYYEKCLKLIKPFGVISLDNMCRGGRVVNPDSTDSATKAIDALNRKIHEDPRVWNSLLILGDGLNVVIVKPEEEVGKSS